MEDQESQIRRMRNSLENFKEIALELKHILLWQKQWHPTAIVSSTTAIFMLLWLFDPNLLSIVAMLGMIVTLSDYFVIATVSLLKKEKWNSAKEGEFEELCSKLVLFKIQLELAWCSYQKMKMTNRKLYFIMTITVLGLLAWIGNTFNNMFLMYVFITGSLLIPGMDYNGILYKWSRTITTACIEFITQAKTKIAQPKLD